MAQVLTKIRSGFEAAEVKPRFRKYWEIRLVSAALTRQPKLMVVKVERLGKEERKLFNLRLVFESLVDLGD